MNGIRSPRAQPEGESGLEIGNRKRYKARFFQWFLPYGTRSVYGIQYPGPYPPVGGVWDRSEDSPKARRVKTTGRFGGPSLLRTPEGEPILPNTLAELKHDMDRRRLVRR
jgi:hypothetical protein